MERKTIDFYKVQKRKISLEENDNTNDSNNLYCMTLDSLHENKSTLKSDLESFFKSCSNFYNANKYYKQCISIMEQLECNNVELINSTSTFFAENIIPYIEHLYLVKDCIDESSLSGGIKEKILLSIKENKICDRVLGNIKSIGKRYDLNKIIDEKRNFPLFESVFDFCRLLDTYEIPEYGKMNIALEQLSYCLQKNGVSYNKEELPSYVTDYFLLSNTSLTDKDIKGFKSVLKENMFLEDDDIRYNPITREDLEKDNNIKYIEDDSITSIINSFKITKEKTVELLNDTIERILSNNKDYIIKNYSYILQFIRNMLLIGTFKKEDLLYCLDNIIDRIKTISTSSNDLDNIILQLEVELNMMDNICVRTGDQETINNIRDYCTKLSSDLEDIINLQCSLYSQDKINSNKNFQIYKESIEPEYLIEFKMFKFQNIINAISHADKFLNNSGNKLVNFIKTKTKRIFSNSKKYFSESESADFNIFTEDYNVNICLYAYEVTDSKDILEMHKVMQNICDTLNNSIKLNESSRFSYNNVDNLFELYLEDGTYIILDDYCLDNNMSEYDMYNSGYIIENAHILEKMVNLLSNKDDILDECIYSIYNKSSDNDNKLLYTLEAMQYIGLFDKKQISDIVKCYKENNVQDFIISTRLNMLLESWNSINIDNRDMSLYSEAIDAIELCLDEAVNLNSIKLSIEGLRKKAKMLGTKEKEMSRNLDATMNHFMNSMQNALTNDRREAIIKGSVIPSFSRCIKYGIALAGIGLINPIAAVITAFCSLALSKNLTRKERSLLIDEIDIELRVLDKEISNAENNNNMKKYRELITYQKKLQREKQRIKYNIKIGKDLPDSNVGTAYQKD